MSRATPPHRPSAARGRRGFVTIVLVVLVLLLLAAGGLAGLIWYHARDLPDFDNLADYKPPQTTRVLAADGSIIGEIFEERRTVVPLDKIAPVMIDALISAEDKNFRNHTGVDYGGVFKAALASLRPGARTRGASTITQQLVKTMLLSSERTFTRKIREAILAHRIEKNLSKDEILEIYLNQVFFGHGRYGVEEASLYYFGKHASELGPGEASLLACIPKDPNVVNPRGNLVRLKERQAYVLKEMVQNGYLAEADARREEERPVPAPPVVTPPPGGYYVEEVKRQLADRLTVEQLRTGGLRVETAMHPAIQSAAEAAVRSGLRAMDKRQGWRGAEARLEASVWSGLKPVITARAASAPAAARASEEGAALWDLSHVDAAAVAKGDPEALSAAAREVAFRPRAVGTELVGRVREVSKSEATVELGSAEGLLPLSAAAWARPYSPGSATPAPRSLTSVVKSGDLVRVRVVKTGSRLELALEQEPKVEGALAAIDPRNREVVALVGGYDHRRSPFNRATQAHRQPGSAFKPIVYAAALEVGRERGMLPRKPPPSPDELENGVVAEEEERCLVFSPRSEVDDAAVEVHDRWTGKTWQPQNYERNAYAGHMTLRAALAASKNTVAVRLLEQIGCDPARERSVDDMQARGMERVRTIARQVGIDSPLPDSLTAALGSGEVVPLELINGFATLAMEGRYAAPLLVRRVVGPGGELLVENSVSYEQPSGRGANRLDGEERGLPADLAFVTTQLMRGVIEDPHGTAKPLAALKRPVAGKTGTASEHRDAWFVGYTPELVAGVWLGFDDHAVMGARETGGHAAAPVWLEFMKSALNHVPKRNWSMPSGVVKVQVDPRNQLLASEHTEPGKAETEYFLIGTEPTEPSPPPDEATVDEFMEEEGSMDEEDGAEAEATPDEAPQPEAEDREEPAPRKRPEARKPAEEPASADEEP